MIGNALSLAVAPARVAVRAAVLPRRAAETVARRGLDTAAALSRDAAWVGRAVFDLHRRRRRRRVWAVHGRAHIEVRGLDRESNRRHRVADGVTKGLRRLRGVHWAEINAATGQVLVAFDEGELGVGALLEAIQQAEEAHGTHDDDFSWEQPLHPGDAMPIAAATTELAVDCVAVMTAVVAKLLPLPPLSPRARLGIALIEVESALRQRLRRRIGPIETDVLIALANAVANGLSAGITAPAIDSLFRVLLLAETWERRKVWERREAELGSSPARVPSDLRAPSQQPRRPQPPPRGPIEEWSDRLGPVAPSAAATVFALTGDPGRAADAILTAVPKAATYGREAFAAVTGRALSRQAILPLNAAAFRWLDRISAIVVDSAVLCGDRPQVLAADAEPDVDIAEVWQAAIRTVNGFSVADLDGPGPWERGGYRLERVPGSDRTRFAVSEKDPESRPGPGRGQERGGEFPAGRSGGRLLGQVTVGRELAPLADAVLDTAGGTGATVLLTDEPSVSDLLPRADEVLDASDDLTVHVRRLQEAGHGVMVVSAVDAAALAAADVGVAVAVPAGPAASVRGSTPPESGKDSGSARTVGGAACWSADLVCRAELTDVWRILRVVSVARGVSEYAVQLAQAGSALGALTALVGAKRRQTSYAVAPVHLAGIIAMVRGAVTGLRATRAESPPPSVHVPWHAFDAEDVLARLQQSRVTVPEAVPATGAAELAVRTREQVSSAASAVAAAPGVSLAVRSARATGSLAGAVQEELRDPLTPVLAVGAIASAILGSGVDAILVGAVMGGNALISGAQRLRADRALRGLLLEQALPARRLRTDDPARLLEVSPEKAPFDMVTADALVPGDMIAVRAADLVPADARLLRADDLEIDESTLTGESMPVSKSVEPTPGAPLAARTCMVYEGTSVLAGSAVAIVVATGQSTEAGRAVRVARRAARPTGVQARLSDLTRIALPVTGIGGAAVTGLGLLRGMKLQQAVAAGISVAVAAVPEGLPLVATVAQAAAARRLSRYNALVRASRTIEALGRVDTVCFDKTGTLTRGRLALTRIASPTDDLDDSDPAALRVLAAAGRACPPVASHNIDAAPHATDRAVLEAAVRAGGVHRAGWELTVELPFEASRGYAAALGRTAEGPVLVVKGAPEVVLALCSAGSAAERTVQRLAADGLRVLAVAERRSGVPAATDDIEPVVEKLRLLGFVGLADTPRPDATEAVRELADGGVRVIMVTGDHPVTAGAIARELGIAEDGVMTGPELDRMTDSERVRRVAQSTVFARVSPEHKVRIVDALQRSGRVVAMTGDGVNDAAAIRLADVGIGVAAHGSASARTAADLVLVDPDVRRVHQALLEGRALWRRIQDAVSILVGCNAGEVAFMVLGTALAGRAPITTRQMLLVNLLTDMFPALAVAIAPRRDDQDIDGPVGSPLGESLVRAVAVRGAATALGALAAWTVGRFTGRGRRASSMGLAALVATQLGQTLVAGRHSPLVIATSVASFGVLFAIVNTPGVSQFFGSTPLGPVAWTVVLAAAAAASAAAALAPRLLARWYGLNATP